MNDLVTVLLIIGVLSLFSPFVYQKRRDRLFKTIAKKYHFDLVLLHKENYHKGFGPGEVLPIRILKGTLGGRDIIVQDVFSMSLGAFSNKYFKISRPLATESFWLRHVFYFPGSYGRTLFAINGKEQDMSNKNPWPPISSFAKRKQISSLLESIK